MLGDKAMPTPKVGRRSFLKMASLASIAGATGALASSGVTRKASEQERTNPFPDSHMVKTVCSVCSVGCGVMAEVHNGVWVRQEVAQDHPISAGGHCCKGSDVIDMVRSHCRVKYPMVKENGKWKRISYTEALDRIGAQLKKYRDENPEQVMFLGSAKDSNEQSYYISKFAAMFGTNNLDHQARI
ncbi:molybdopterin-dependent oxidoreductase [Campylobacter sp. faydin G-24]|uniref:Molybdopterin-dependent oxidoreductase n=1 Tax=Campylobacter anatolicus TaxID=2829105 RepID=A0ABS5HGG9_9BACT|nr:molybdopterin-dependent oxidoreductase [Campylobacter anatolicus]MBR8463376.1 molybdopterin-dependent oxidoreductase [Campylobacter anatolicus]